MTTCAVIPVKGRFPLLVWTVARLFERNRIDHVVLVGNEDEAEEIAGFTGADWIYHPNNPLGAKWNAGWKYAMEKYNPDYYVFVGSSDWLCDRYLEIMLPYMDSYDIIGVRGMYLYDIGEFGRRCCMWKGYSCERAGESIGIGRILSGDLVRKMGGEPFMPHLDNSLDFSMMRHAESFGARVGLVTHEQAKTLSLSCWKWPNKHNFEDHWKDHLNNDVLGDGKYFLKDYFPDALEMTL